MLGTGGCPDSGENWEEGCYQPGCRLAKEVAVRYLESKAAELDKQRPDGYRVKNTNPRTLVTRFGDVTFKRQLYQDRQGEYHFLLDEHLNLRPNQVATPSLTEALVDTATKLSFRKTAEEVHKYTAGVLCASTVHRLLQRVTQDVIQKEKMEWEACFKRGVIPPPGKRKVDILSRMAWWFTFSVNLSKKTRRNMYNIPRKLDRALR
mgnify:CR=1 FL=1